MGRKALAVVPALGTEYRLERFHNDATEHAMYTVVTWTAAARKRQLVIVGASKKLLEMQRFQPPADARSWFIGNDVQSDGSVLVLTPLDPLFVLVASSWRQRSRAMALSDLLAQDHNAWLTQVAACTLEKIRVVCDVQDGASEDDCLESLFVTANEAKILAWLSAKVRQVAKTLAQQATEARAQSDNSSVDAKFVLPGQTSGNSTATVSSADAASASTAPATPLDASAFVRDAIELVVDYLPSDIADLLYQELKIEKLEAPAKASSGAAGLTNPHEAFQRFDRRHQDSSDGSSSINKRTPSPAAAALAKKKSKLANVDRTGMKSLTSFFTKK